MLMLFCTFTLIPISIPSLLTRGTLALLPRALHQMLTDEAYIIVIKAAICGIPVKCLGV